MYDHWRAIEVADATLLASVAAYGVAESGDLV